MGRPPSFLLSLGAVDFPRCARFILGWICLAISGTRDATPKRGRRLWGGRGEGERNLQASRSAGRRSVKGGSVTDKSPCCPRGEFSSDRVDVERMDAVGSPWNGRFPLSIHFFCLFPNSFPPFRIAYIHGIWNTMSFFGQPGN